MSRWKDDDPDWLWVDPICTFFFGFLAFLMTKDLLTWSLRDLMDAVPTRINIDNVRKQLTKIKGVIDVCELHVWSISFDETMMTAHLTVQREYDSDAVNAKAETLSAKLGITHCNMSCTYGAEGA